MTAPIRTNVYILTEFPKDAEEMTLRECLQWFKNAVTGLDGQALNMLEHDYLNKRWATLCEAVGEREGVPTGSLSYFLGELAQAEIKLKESGDLEASQVPDVPEVPGDPGNTGPISAPGMG